MSKKPSVVIALGGNALIQRGQKGTAEDQFNNLKAPMKAVVDLCKEYNVVITHGNGPQVGNILLQQAATSEVPEMPLAVVGAMTQGQIGFMIESTLEETLKDAGINDQRFCTLVSYVAVDGNDPGFKNPTKPVGPFYKDKPASDLPMVETAHGWRRVVASPRPEEIVNQKDIKLLIDNGYIVICVGGGGIPVVKKGNGFVGVDAVIDKDLATALLAEVCGLDFLIIATDEKGVCIDYKKPTQKMLSKMTTSECQKYLDEGQFPAGSMGPKVQAAMEFAQRTGKTAIITSIEDIPLAVKGQAGTSIVKG